MHYCQEAFNAMLDLKLNVQLFLFFARLFFTMKKMKIEQRDKEPEGMCKPHYRNGAPAMFYLLALDNIKK